MDRRLGALALVAAALLSLPASAEDVEKKWRLSVALGGYNALDDAPSNAANSLAVVDRVLFNEGKRELTAFYDDPRADTAAFGALDVQAGVLGTLTAQYALTKTFLVEASIGYHTAEIGNIELSGQFNGDPPPIEEIVFNFRTFQVPVGDFTRVPIQLDGIFRFRPRAKFNPYVGAGIGYSFIGFDPSDELNTLSYNIDRQSGFDCSLTSSLFARATMPCTGLVRDLRGIEVAIGDSFEYNVVVGGEVTFKRKSALIIDLRYVGASRQVEVKIDNGLELGDSVPQLVDFDNSSAAIAGSNGVYGAVRVGSNDQVDVGLADVGYRKLVPSAQNPGADCSFPEPSDSCVARLFQSPGAGQLLQDFTGEVYRDTDPGDGDGRLDPGQYYVQGGAFSWSGLSLQIGFRYTF